ncbi:hypothetical protein IJJ97_01360 [bacterium]|nr:hypothetical protein [bacterium]
MKIKLFKTDIIYKELEKFHESSDELIDWCCILQLAMTAFVFIYKVLTE